MPKCNFTKHIPGGDCAGLDNISADSKICGESNLSDSSHDFLVILSLSFWTAEKLKSLVENKLRITCSEKPSHGPEFHCEWESCSKYFHSNWSLQIITHVQNETKENKQSAFQPN